MFFFSCQQPSFHCKKWVILYPERRVRFLHVGWAKYCPFHPLTKKLLFPFVNYPFLCFLRNVSCQAIWFGLAKLINEVMEDSVSVSLSNRYTTNLKKKKKRFRDCSWPRRGGSQKVAVYFQLLLMCALSTQPFLGAPSLAQCSACPQSWVGAGTLEPHAPLECLKPMSFEGRSPCPWLIGSDFRLILY